MGSIEALKILDGPCGDYLRMLAAQSPNTEQIVQRSAVDDMKTLREALSANHQPDEHG